MTAPQRISLRWPGFIWPSFCKARAGDVRYLFVHGLRYPEAIRNTPPRIRLLEDAREPLTDCELLDPWDGAPATWPEEEYGRSPVHEPKQKRGRK